MRGRTLFLWSFLVVLGLSAAFGFSIFYNVEKVVRRLGVGSTEESFSSSGNLAVLEIKGVIDDPESALRDIEELEDKASIKAVVVRVSSPGGAVGPTQEIYNALLRLRAKKKLLCSFGDIAASGGYYLAAACEKIYANPGTLTGSIGVIMHFMNLKDLYQWAKVQPVTLKAGKFKDIGNESRLMTDEEKTLMQEMLTDVHNQFKEAIRKSRKMPADVVETYADGRVFSGAQAKALGFVDELGGEFEAIRAAAKLAGITGKPEVIRANEGRGRPKISDFFEGKFANAILNRLLHQVKAPGAVTSFSLKEGVPYFLPANYAGSAP